MAELDKKALEALTGILVRTADHDPQIALSAQYEFAKAMSLPLREGVLDGDIITEIFTPHQMPAGQTTDDFPVDLLAPGTEDEFIAFTNPGAGSIPYRQVEGDYIKLQTFGIANSIDWLLRYARAANWNVVGR